MMSFRRIFLVVLLIVPVLGNAQLTPFSQDIDFNTANQGMWGPVIGSFTLDEDITLFNVPWDVSWDTGNAAIVSILGQQFGGSFNGNFSGVIGSEVRIEGFTTGEVDIDYPIEVDIDYSTNATYDPGDQVRINTDYSVRSGYDVETRYPQGGEFFWDIYFQMAAGANAQLCVFGCTTFPIIPQFDTGVQTLNMVTISSTGNSTNGNGTGAWFLGPGDPSTASALSGLGPWPYSLEPQTSGPYNTTTLGATWVPWQCYVSAFPAELPGAFGLSGELTLPFVPDAPDSLSGTTLSSIEDSTYFTIQLELFQMLGGILSSVPEPTLNTVGNVLSNLSGSQSLGPAEIEWNFFSAFFQGDITNKQRFSFSPTISGLFQFPVAVDYEVRDATNALVSSGNSSMVNVELGQDILYDFPCYYDEMEIDQIYSIDGQFRNRTYDSVAFSFNMSALAFALEVPEITITPEINVPEICVPIPYPCPTWSNPFRWCTSTVCTPAFTIPAVVFPALNIDIGPVWETSIPLGDFQYDWFDQTWTMPGFTDQPGVPFTMRAYDYNVTSSHVDNDCFGNSLGTVTVNIDAESDATDYIYTWTNGTTTTTTANTQTLTNLPAGNYNVSIIDGNGCQLFTGETVEEPQDLTFLFSTTDVTCNGANDGELSVTAQGGTGVLSYDIGAGPQASSSFTGLAPGTYNFTVSDVNNCSKTTTFSIDEPTVLVQSGIVTDVNCNAGNDGAVDVSVGGGTLPYNYSWNNGATTQDLSDLTAGTYTLTVTDGRNCASVEPYTVNQPANPLALSATFTDVNCFDGADGSIDVTTTGGTPGYTYLWTSNGQGVLPFTTEDLTNLSADTYTIIATDVNGCTEQLTQVIDEPNAPLSSTPVLVDILCFGNATGSIDPGIAGGTTPYTYNWSTGSTANSLSGLPAGTYTLDLSDANGCTDQYTYTLTEPTAALTVTLAETDVLCFGDATGVVDATVTGGTTPYSFAWNSGATTEDLNNIVAGTYDIIVTDANLCTATAAVTVDQPAAPLALSTTVVDVDCFGNSTGSIDLTVTGGTVGYEYDWTNGGFVLLSDTSQDLTNIPADDYTVFVTDANGCQETITATITEPAAPLALSGIVDDVNCFGTNDGAIDAAITGGTVPYTYSWSNGATTEDITAIPAGTYTLTITDDNGCTISETWDVIQPAAPLNIDLFATAVDCNGESTGEIDATVTGGTMPYDYSWSNGEVTSDIENIPAGIYTLTVTDAQGCVAFTGITVDEPPLLTITPVITDASCFGYSDGQIQINVAGGVQPYYFNWGNQNEVLLNNPSETITGLSASDYFVRVRDENGCITEQTLTVGEPTPFFATNLVTDALCNGSPDGAIDMTVVGGTTPYTYQWSDGQVIEDPINLISGFYTYEFTDDQGCIITDSVFVGQPDEIQVTYFIDPVSCIDQSDAVIDVTTFGGTEPYSFLWTTGAISEDAADLAPGTYELTVTDDNLCTETFTFIVDVNLTECLIVPNTFTPNGDNYNDTWVIGNIDLYPDVTVKVFNEWGNEIFTSVGMYDPWDGTHRGNALPAGVYYYIIVLNNNEDNKYTGTISIVR
jgi:gliding motility-associated-like protein